MEEQRSQKVFDMPQNSVHILITRPVDESMLYDAREAGLNMEVVSFIETEPIQTVQLQQEVELVLLQSATIVFTSANAVEAVAAQSVDHDPDWEIFCIGRRTKELVEEHFGKHHIAGYANNASELAQVILETTDAREIIFFCGDNRRPELPHTLKEHDIHVEEIVVYQTIGLPRKVNKHYQGILFFSPSAVDSFFQLNVAAEKTVFFAIGNTTAQAIRKHTTNKILVSDQPDKNHLVEMAIEYFT
jgi:uroporphyrinogen-III synthase